MHIATIILISFGLAMDSFAASITRGISAPEATWKNGFTAALLFGFFQAFMPVIGWYAGFLAEDMIVSFDHWVAFGLLAIIGSHMLYEGFTGNDQSSPNSKTANIEAFSLTTLLFLAIATSIDALATGVSFSCLQVKILLPVFFIGLITFILSLIGVRIGKQCGGLLGQRAKMVGGLILLGIGTKILASHLGFFAFG